MKTIITYGTYDLLHVGHIRLLRRARALGDYLIVGLSTDEFNASKGKKSVFSYSDRREILQTLALVDDVIPEDTWEQKRENITHYGADLLVMGDDWSGKFDDLADITEVVYLSRTEDISTTEVKTVIRKLSSEKLQALEHTLEQASKIVQSLV